MKRVFIFFTMISLPGFIFPQGIHKTHLALTAGANFALLSESFRKDYPLGVNAGFQHEWTANDDLSLGWEFNLEHSFPGEKELDPMQFGAVQFFTKFQDNYSPEDLQLFIKTGAGLGAIGRKKSGGHPGLIPFSLAFTGGTGANFNLKNGDRIFSEISYRAFYTGSYYSSVSLNIGYSFWLNRTAKKI